MKALVLIEYNKFEYKNVTDPQINPDEILVQVKACGICGSDVHGMDGSSGRRQPPIIMGHEASGIIAKVGDKVTKFKLGDRVTFDSTVYCGDCYFCKKGLHHLCDNRRVLGVACDEYIKDGAMAEYIAVPEKIVYLLPDKFSFEEAAMIEPVSVAFHAVNNTPIKIDDSAVVIGTGIIGLLIIQALRITGCGHISAIDVNKGRLKLANDFGADAIYTPGKETESEIINKFGSRGPDHVFEAVGMNASLSQAFRIVRKGGNIVLVGNISKQVDLPLQSVVSREVNLISSCANNGEYPSCIDMLSRKRVNLKPLLSATPKLSEGGAWFKKLHDNIDNLFKVLLIPEG